MWLLNIIKIHNLTSIVWLVNHADMISDQGEVSNSHRLINETSSVSGYKNWTAHVSWQECGKSLMSYSVSLIVMDSSIPDNCSSTLHYGIKNLLLVSYGCRDRAMWDIVHANNFDIRDIFKKMIWQIQKSGAFNDCQVNLLDTKSFKNIVCCLL